MKKAIAVIALLAFLYALSWAICVGIMCLICLCFSWKFSLILATGIWLIMCLIKGIFPNVSKK